ncbi:MAG TPA: hypothetical protein QGH10_01020, partial [Armatimonadota bacterium]|nr:hypothetical protein [Armatimonadota bacterium]
MVKGSEVATGWEQTAGDIHAADWETPADIVFADGDPLTQIGLQGNPKRAASTNGFQWKRDRDGNGIADMRPGSFHYNADAKRLHVWLADGSDPADHLIEVGVRGKAVQLSGT